MTNEELLEKLADSMHYFCLNIGDTFGYGCAEEYRLIQENFIELIPYFIEYGHTAFNAYIAIQKGRDVLPELQSEKYFEVKKKLLEIEERLYFEWDKEC